MADVKTAAKPSSQAGKPKNANNFMLNLIIVVACIAIGQIVYHVVFGSASNFLDAEKHKPKNFMGNMYLGGAIVPFLIATFLTMLSFVVERFMTIFKANGNECR
eukprot:GDKJ01022354.1.p1 GENE.GDKJ01022354.1~~GDKJ01022354.1.p1  ORF type:complete len:104 (-),score=11.40 GDKJ01022354.1:191-502(-)